MPAFPVILGCHGASRHGQLVTSVGLADLDGVLGDGIAVGNVCLVMNQPAGSVFAGRLRDGFFKEGLKHGHGLFHGRVASACDADCAARSATFEIVHCYGATVSDDLADPVSSMLDSLRKCTAAEEFSAGIGGRKNIMRVVIDDIGSWLWCDQEKLASFAVRLRCMLRHCNACCLLFSPLPVCSRLPEQLPYFCDIVLDVQEFSRCDPAVNPSYGHLLGLLKIVKLSNSGRVAQRFAEHSVYGFKKAKASLTIEPLHIPPSLEETGPKMSCQSFMNL